jgi:hypothetical protein
MVAFYMIANVVQQMQHTEGSIGLLCLTHALTCGQWQKPMLHLPCLSHEGAHAAHAEPT